MGKVFVEIDSKWVKTVRSPLYLIVGTLQGVAISFVPLFLYVTGKGGLDPAKGWLPRWSDWITVPLCVAIIALVGLFYIRLGSEVAVELRKLPRNVD
jgi:hypothetical protein